MLLLRVALLIAASSATAWGGQPLDIEETELHERWSWAPLISAAFAGGSSDGPPALFGAQIRARYGRARDSNMFHPRDTPMLVSFGLAIDTAGFDTVEPSAVVGLHRLPDFSEVWGNYHVWWDLRADIGVGYAWAERDAPFVTVKLAMGAMLARQVKYSYGDRFSYSKDRFRSQMDFFVASQLTLDGEWRMAMGIELDPLRLVPDLLAIFRSL
jgi:hypothetical protein